MYDDIKRIASEIAAAKDGHRQDATFKLLSELRDRELIPEVPSYWFDQQGEPLPFSSWTAAEIGVFDNRIGETKTAALENPVDERRGRVRTQKTCYGMRFKLWCDRAQHFSARRPAAFSFNCSMFKPSIVERTFSQLVDHGYLKRKTLDFVLGFEPSGLDDDRALIGTVRKQGRGTTYLNEHIALLKFDEDGVPLQAALIGIEGKMIGGFLADQGADGKPLKGKCVATARVARDAGSLGNWESE